MYILNVHNSFYLIVFTIIIIIIIIFNDNHNVIRRMEKNADKSEI